MFDNLKLVVNTSKDPQIVFTDYFYRRLALSMLIAYNVTDYQNSIFLPEISPNLSNEYENGVLKYSSGLYRDSNSKILKIENYISSINRTIGNNSINTIGLNPLFYRTVYGMFVSNSEFETNYYKVNSPTSENNYNYYNSKYNSWYYYNSSNGELILFYPPTWHINPAINVEGTIPTETNLNDSLIFNVIPFGNLVTIPKITFQINSSSVNPINNVIDIYIENTINVSDLKNQGDDYLFNGQFCITSMAVVDIFGQPLILATFPLKPLSESITLKDEYIISLGIPYLQP